MSGEFRLPNRILTPEERGRAQRLKGLDENNLPLSLTDAEREAAQTIPPSEAITPKENFMPDANPVSPTGAAVVNGQGWLLKAVIVLVAIAGAVAMKEPDLFTGTELDQTIAQGIVTLGTIFGLVSPGLRKA